MENNKKCDSNKKISVLDTIDSKLVSIRGQKVLMDWDCAEIYKVDLENLNQQVKRNKERFPSDFMFQLTKEELEDWKCQFGISNSIKMGLRKLPYVFSEQGVYMLAIVLESEIAMELNKTIISKFIDFAIKV